MTDGQSGWQPAMLPDGPLSPSTPVRPPNPDAPPPPITERFDAVGMQSVLTRARDQSRFVAPEIEEERPRRPVPVRGLLWAGIAILVLGIAIGVVYVNQRATGHDPDTIYKPPVASATAEVVTAQTPQEIVREYFDALSSGSLDRALAMGETGGNGSEDLLNAEVFARARELSPITDVEILESSTTATEVPVRYVIGGEPFETVIPLVLLDTGEYQLARTTMTVEFSIPGGENLPLLVNGHGADQTQTYEVVPGSYEVSTGLPFVDYAATSHLHVVSVWNSEVRTVNVTPTLTDAGLTALQDAARRSLEACMASGRLAPEGCPNAARAAGNQSVSSANWRLTNNPWTSASPALMADDQSIALMRVQISTALDVSYANGSSSSARPQFSAEVRAMMLGSDPADIDVSWATA